MDSIASRFCMRSSCRWSSRCRASSSRSRSVMNSSRPCWGATVKAQPLGRRGCPVTELVGVMGGHRRLLNLQLQLRRRWSGCGYSSGHSQPVDTGTVIQLGPDSQTGAMQAESVRVSQPSQHWLDEVYEEEIQQVGTPHLTSLWSMLEKSMPLTSTIWSPVWARRTGLVCVHVCDPYIHLQKGLLACQT